MMPLKYEIDYDTKTLIGDKYLCRIRALKDFNDVKQGDVGGFVESESNLSHDGNCWIYDNAIVHGAARVERDAKVKESATVSEYAVISDKAVVAGEVKVFQRALIYDSAKILGMASVYGNAQVFESVRILGNARVHDDAWVYGNFEVDSHANITRKTTEKPIVLTGFTYDITIMDEHISIDCQTKSFDEWRSVTREEAYAMNGRDSLRFFKHIPDTLEFLVQKYRRKQSNV